MGFGVHVMVVPAGTGTANVPLPHPFIGEMKEALSSDVKIGSKKCAVTGGTSGKVKIDGKEAAVIGSTVTTCNLKITFKSYS